MKTGCKTNIKKKNVCTRAISLALLAAVFGASLSAGSLLCLSAPQVLDLQKQVNSGMQYLHTLGYKNAVIASGYCGAEHDRDMAWTLYENSIFPWRVSDA